jgi:hypothetical protein
VSLRVPLSVRLKTSLRDMHITAEVSDLTFGSASPGGYTNCTLTLYRPISFTPGEVAQFGRVYVYDGRTAETVWEGRLQDPGRTAGDTGQTYQLAAFGGSAHLQDDTRLLVYIDRRFDPWIKARTATGERQIATVNAGEAPSDGSPALVNSFPTMDVTLGAACTAGYYGLEEAGQELAVFDYSWDAGLTNALWDLVGYSSGATQVRANNANTAGGGGSVALVGTSFPLGDARPLLQLKWAGGASSTGTGGTVWAAFKNICVRAITYNADGTKKTSGYTVSDQTILASTVVADLLGRILTATVDGANATITATTYAIEQLAYSDGVTPAKVLEDLQVFEPGYTWHLWESNPLNSKFRFEWLPWPSTVRYEADVIDGFSTQESGNTLFNKVVIRWRDMNNKIRITTRTSTVPALTAAGLTRTSFIDLGDDAASSANAIQAGDQFLAEHRQPVNAGRLTVRRPIVDHLTGRMVMPWQLRAGNLIRVRGVQPYPDSLNQSGRDGVTVFRVAGTTYSAAEAEATLELDSYAPSMARAVAALARRPITRRR